MNRNLACYTLALSGLLAISPSAVAADAVDDLNWCPESIDCLTWSPSLGATSYNVYRGDLDQLPALLGAATDSCSVGTYATTSTGAFAEGAPRPGELRWYLVGAIDRVGQENAGLATAGPRDIDSAGDCQATATLLLNEVDYDQVGTDGAEFVEIYNRGTTVADLAGIVLILVNGTTQAEYDRIALRDAGPSLAPGGFLVIGASGVQAALPPGTPFVAFEAASNNIQNGAPDGIALFDTASGTLLDALSYEGSIVAATFDDVTGTYNLVEGTPTPLADSNSMTGALGRFGSDTDDAATDWFFLGFLSPGAANPIP